MPNIYKRKYPEKTFDEKAMKEAVKAVLEKKETASSAAKKYGVKRTTILSRLSRIGDSRTASLDQMFSSKHSGSQVLSKQQENELTTYFKKCSRLHHGLTLDVAKKFVYEYVIRNEIDHPSNWDRDKMAGKVWLQGFMRRNSEISLRKPENTSAARLRGFTKVAVNGFFENLKNVYTKFILGPDRIYNLDETGITTVLESPKVICVFLV